MKQTSVFGFNKPEDSDNADLIKFISDNMDKIEILLKDRNRVFVGNVAPSNPQNNDLWIDTN